MRIKNALLSNYNYSRGNIFTVDLIPMGSIIINFTMEIRAKAYFVNDFVNGKYRSRLVMPFEAQKIFSTFK
jgi:ribosomal protein L2